MSITLKTNIEEKTFENTQACKEYIQSVRDTIVTAKLSGKADADMSYMFAHCSTLESVDVQDLDLSDVTDMSYLLFDCHKFINYDRNYYDDTSKVTNMSWMFACNASTLAQLKDYIIKQMENYTYKTEQEHYQEFVESASLINPNLLEELHIDRDPEYPKTYLQSLDSKELEDYPIYHLQLQYDVIYNKYGYNIATTYSYTNLYKMNTSNVTNMQGMFFGWARSFPNRYKGWNISATGETIGALQFNTSKVKDMSWMFVSVPSVRINEDDSHFNFDAWDTSNVEDMTGMFASGHYNYGMVRYYSDQGGPYWIEKDFSKVKSMKYLFLDCSSSYRETNSKLYLKNSGASSSLEDISYMYKNVKFNSDDDMTIELNNFNLSNITTLESCFENCTYINTINFNNPNLSKVTTMKNAFKNSYIKNIDFSSWTFRDLEDISYIFKNAGQLTSKIIFENCFSQCQIKNMEQAFYDYQGIGQTLDLSSIKTQYIESLNDTFYSSEHLKINYSWGDQIINFSSLKDITGYWKNTKFSDIDYTIFENSPIETIDYLFSAPDISIPTNNWENVGENIYQGILQCEGSKSVKVGRTYFYVTVDEEGSIPLTFNGNITNWDSKNLYLYFRLYIGTGIYPDTIITQEKNISANTETFTYTFNSATLSPGTYLVGLEVSNGYYSSYYSQTAKATISVQLNENWQPYIPQQDIEYDYVSILKHFNNANLKSMNYTFSGLKLSSLDFTGIDTTNITSMQGLFSSNLISIDQWNDFVRSIDLSSVKDLSNLLYGTQIFNSEKTEQLKDFSLVLEAPNVENINYLVCTGAENLSVSINSNKIISAEYAFSSYQTKTIDISNVNLNHVTSLKGAFSCNSLTYINFGNYTIDTEVSWEEIFKYCSNLQSISLGEGFKSQNIINIKDMVYGCTDEFKTYLFNLLNVSKMKSVASYFANTQILENLSIEFNNATDLSYLFENAIICADINIIAPNANKFVGMFKNANFKAGKVNYVTNYTPSENEVSGYQDAEIIPLIDPNLTEILPEAVGEDNAYIYSTNSSTIDLTEYKGAKVKWTYDGVVYEDNIKMYETSGIGYLIHNYNLSEGPTGYPSFLIYSYGSNFAIEVILDEGQEIKPITSIITRVYEPAEEIKISGFNFNNNSNVLYMFDDTICSDLDLTGLNTQNIITGFSNMFKSSSKYTTTSFLNIPIFKAHNWILPDTIKDLEIFEGITTGTRDLSGWSLPEVTDFGKWFQSKTDLILNISNWNAPKLKTMSEAFKSCTNLTLITNNVSTPNLTNWFGIFQYATLNDTDGFDFSTWDTSSVQFFNAAFAYMNTTSGTLDLSNLNVSGAVYIQQMFYYNKATNVILDNWVLGNVQSTGQMFFYASMKTISMDNFDWGHTKEIFLIFPGCNSLTSYTLNWRSDYTQTMFRVFDNSAIHVIDDSTWDFPGLRCIRYLDADYELTSVSLTGNYPNLEIINYAYTGATEAVFKINAPKLISMSQCFQNCKATTIDLSEAYIPHVTLIEYMFQDCTNLTSITFPHIEPYDHYYIDLVGEWVTAQSWLWATAEGMFEDCYNLQQVDLSNINFEHIYDMSRMFANTAMTSINFGITNFPQVLTMSQMFAVDYYVYSKDYGPGFNLGEVDLSSWIAPNLRDISQMFRPGSYYYKSSRKTEDRKDLLKITELKGVKTFLNNASKLTNINRAFATSQSGIFDLSNLGENNFKDISGILCYCPNITEINLSNNNFKALENNHSYSGTLQYNTETETVDYIERCDSSFQPLINKSYSVQKLADCYNSELKVNLTNTQFPILTIAQNFFGGKIEKYYDLTSTKFQSLEDFSYGFSGNTYLCQAIGLDTILFNSNLPINVNYLFRNCSNLEQEIKFNNSLVIGSMYGTFDACSKITKIDLSNLNYIDQYATSGYILLSMNNICRDCSSLVDFKMPQITMTTEGTDYKVMNGYGAFSGCSSLTQLDLRNLNLDKYDSDKWIQLSFGSMFKDCISLQSIQFPTISRRSSHNWATDDIYNMFENCNKLNTIENFLDYNIITDDEFQNVFKNCKKLTNISIPNWKYTSSYRCNTSSMFEGCESLVTVNIPWFKNNVTNSQKMFYNCSNLKRIFADNVEAPSTTSTDVFTNCVNLKGSIPYDAEKTDSNYASILGYFTSLTNGMFITYTSIDQTILEDGDEFFATTDTFKTWMHNATQQSAINSITISGKPVGTDIDASYLLVGSSLENNSILTTLNVSDFDTSEITNATGMFAKIPNVSTITGLNDLDFYKCKKFESFLANDSILTGVNLTKVTGNIIETTKGMFENCSALTSLDLKSFKVTKTLTNIENMFKNCSSLVTISADGDWEKKTSATATNMFEGCTNLIGVVPFDPTKIGSSMANAKTGYFFGKMLAVTFNGNIYSTIKFNGQEISEIKFNGISI